MPLAHVYSYIKKDIGRPITKVEEKLLAEKKQVNRIFVMFPSYARDN